MNYVLASASPRRKELMKKISSVFLIDASNIDETIEGKHSPKEENLLIAIKKGEAIKDKYPNDIVISADTVVVLDDQSIGKPTSVENAKEILRLLSDKTHIVYTSYAVFYKNKMLTNTVASYVTFNKLSEELIDKYVASGIPMDKAGGYAAQEDQDYHLVKETKGSFDNIIGFPVDEIIETIRKITE